MALALTSCDTFVCLPPITEDGLIIFGKNSDRPAGEVQELLYQAEAKHEPGTKLRCTYIDIDQVSETAAVMLSKPSWMWGAEMGANSHGVCIGNEAVWTKLNSDDDLVERLLGMDLVRLGLERGSSARDALDVITVLLEKYGQGGACSDTMTNFSYHNSFLIVDRKEAWVLDTVGRLWAAEKVESGVRHISNCLSIGTKIDLSSSGLFEAAESLKFWKPADGEFHFEKVFGDRDPCESGRIVEGRRLLQKYSENNGFDMGHMMDILRNEESGINMGYDDSFQSTASQVSVMSPKDLNRPPCHWFTGTPDPKHSIFKPFVFCVDTEPTKFRFRLTTKVSSPALAPEDRKVDRRHELYKVHESAYLHKMDKRKSVAPSPNSLCASMTDLENILVSKIKQKLNSFQTANETERNELYQIFNTSIDLELHLYNLS